VQRLARGSRQVEKSERETDPGRNAEDVEVLEEQAHVLETGLGGSVTGELLILQQTSNELLSTCAFRAR
jgi:hypothetical protein